MTTQTDPLRDIIIKEFMEAGYTDEDIQAVLTQQEALRHSEDEDGDKAKVDQYRRPTWIKVYTKHMSPATLDAYHLPWEYDPIDENYVLIKKWISLEFQEELFAHTRQSQQASGGQLRGTHGAIEPKLAAVAELKVHDRFKRPLAAKRIRNGKDWVYR